METITKVHLGVATVCGATGVVVGSTVATVALLLTGNTKTAITAGMVAGGAIAGLQAAVMHACIRK